VTGLAAGAVAAFAGFAVRLAGATFFSALVAAGLGACDSFFVTDAAVFGAVPFFFGGVTAGAAAFGVTAFFVVGVVFLVAIFILSIRFYSSASQGVLAASC
jgi:hypothetical protein